MNADTPRTSRIPDLSDDVIGCIFDHIIPQELLKDDPATATLKTSCLVSHRFAYYGRRGLYQDVHLLSTRRTQHYLDLCQRYIDMPGHIKRISIGSVREDWCKDAGAESLAALFDILASHGAVSRVRILFQTPWDQWKPVVQTALVRFLLASPFDVIELVNTCECFPFSYLPLPQMSKRIMVEGFTRKEGSFASECSARGISAEIVEACSVSNQRRPPPLPPPLESLWIQVDAFDHLRTSLSHPTFQGFKELHLAHVPDNTFPTIMELLSAASETLERLSFFVLRVPTCNFPYLSQITSITFPRLHTLSITVHNEPGDEPLKSMAWYLLHARRNRKIRVQKLNLIFCDIFGNPLDPAALMIAPIRNLRIIHHIFQAFDFFKLEGVLTDLLHPEGKISIWFLLNGITMWTERTLIRQGIEKSLPRLHAANRVERGVGSSEEHIELWDSLSLSPRRPFMSKHQFLDEQVPPSDDLRSWYPDMFED